MGAINGRRDGSLAQIGAWITCAGLVVGAFSFAAAALPLKLGVAPAITQMVVAVHAAALVAALGLTLLVLARPQSVVPWFVHPLAISFFGVAAWSAIAAPFVEYPWGSLLGSEYFGEGGLLYLDMAVFVTASAVLMRDRLFGRVILAAGLSACVLVPPLFRFVIRDESVAGQILPEFLAPFALAGPVFAWALMSLRWRARWGYAALLASAPALIAATNVTAWVAVLAVGAPVAAITAWCMAAREWRARRIRRLAFFSVPFVFVATTGAVMAMGAFGVAKSIESRFHLIEVISARVADAPIIWLLGQGWGRTPSVVNAYLTAADVTLWDGTWDATRRLFIHSHNHAIELFLAAGMPGALLGLFGIAIVAGTARRTYLPVAIGFAFATAVFLSAWFFVAGNWPIIAMAAGVLVGRRTPLMPAGINRRRGAVALALVATACLAAGLIWHVDLGWNYRRYLHEPLAAKPARLVSCADVPVDAARGGDALEHAMRLMAFPLFRDLKAGTSVDEARIARFLGLLCRIDQASETIRSPNLLSVPVVVRGHLAFEAALIPLHARMPGLLDDWAIVLKRYLEAAPRRADMAAAYMEWELVQGNVRTVMAVVDAILRRDPDDPVGLWYAGKVLATLDDPRLREEGYSLQRRAIRFGIRARLNIGVEG